MSVKYGTPLDLLGNELRNARVGESDPLPDPASNAGVLARNGGTVYISDGAEWQPATGGDGSGSSPAPASPVPDLRAEHTGTWWCAHRCDADIFPEATLEAMDATLAAGVADVLEVDVRLTSDGVLVCHHDANTSRIMTSTVEVADQTVASWRLLRLKDRWGPAWAAQTLAPVTLAEVLRRFADKVLISIEPKTQEAGDALPGLLDQHVRRKSNVVIPSFTYSFQVPARDAGYPLATRPATGTPAADILTSGAVQVNVPLSDVTRAWVDDLHEGGVEVWAWTLNRQYEVDQALARGCDGIITDDTGYVSRSKRRASDPFASQGWYHGHLSGGSRNGGEPTGRFVAPDEWGYDNAQGVSHCESGVLQGWACPIKGDPQADSYEITYDLRVAAAYGGGSNYSVALGMTDEPYGGHPEVSPNWRGYVMEENASNLREILWHPGDGTTVLLDSFDGSDHNLPFNQSRVITVTPSSITFRSANGTHVVSADPGPYGPPGGYLTLCSGGLEVFFRNVSIT